MTDSAPMTANRRPVLLALAAGVAVLAISIPVLAASPSPDPSASASASVEPSASVAPSSTPSAAPSISAAPSSAPAEPSATAQPLAPAGSEEPGGEKPEKADTGPELAVTVAGTVVAMTDGDGHPGYTITASAKTWQLSAGPAWFWGTKNPLNAFVGKSVTVVGSTETGGAEIDVDTVDGKQIRAPGKPPWAGGPWVVGPTHPGWKSWMAGGKPGHGIGRDTAPGQVDKGSATP
jgi:hypothetical protein